MRRFPLYFVLAGGIPWGISDWFILSSNGIARPSIETFASVVVSPQRSSDMMQVVWNGAVIAEAADTVVVEGNHYFPTVALRQEFFRNSDTQTVCPWKGTASYYSIVVGDKTNVDAAWYYPEPKSAASSIKGKVAFWKGVEVKPKA